MKYRTDFCDYIISHIAIPAVWIRDLEKSVQRPPVVKKPSVIIALKRHVLVFPCSVACCPLHPFLAIAVLRILDVFPGGLHFAIHQIPINISRMRNIAPCHNPKKPLFLSRPHHSAVGSAILPWIIFSGA